MNSLQLTNNLTTRNLAKIDRNFILKIVKNDLKIESSTLDLLLCMSVYVDLDFKITISVENLRKKLNMRKETFEFALNQAINLDLIIVTSNQELYSKIHLLADDQLNDFIYLQNLELFSSSKFQNLTLNQKKLFLYFASATKNGYRIKVAAKSLYKNSLHTDKNVGVTFFQTYREAIEALIVLTNLGFIEVNINSQANISEPISNSDNLFDFDCANLINQCLQIPGRKSRIKWLSIATKNNITFSVKVTNQTIAHLEASSTEIRELAESFEMPHEYIDCEEQFNFLIGYKNDLYALCGTAGLALYRKCLDKYFDERGHFLDYYVSNGKLANYFKDYYLNKSIKKMVVQNIDLLKNTTSLISQKLLKTQIENMLLYLKDSLLQNELLVYIEELNARCIDVEVPGLAKIDAYTTGIWLKYYDEFLSESKYTIEFEVYKSQFAVQFKLEQIDTQNLFIQQIKNIVDHEAHLKKIVQLKEKIQKKLEFYSQNNKVPTPKLYNWLEIRD